ncbi:hypothetical protein Clacol_008323 [Clathrus columnatus]|uniref:Wax synthase domain-containing protein n=1 Tax=Clathrus columnatus TaxID=1419009 RepID=A0AAV5AMB9_9AGAM|nr:hypothetical protein Clacol_008323 [Clathrus columnatus]
MGLGLVSLTMFAKALDFIFSTPTNNIDKQDRNTTTFMVALSEANTLMSTVRGIGIEHGKAIPLPPETRSLEKRLFLKATFFMFLRSYILFDLLEFTLKLTPPLRTYKGGSIYVESLPIPQRLILAMFIHISTGCFIIEVMQAAYFFATLMGVGVLNQSPSLWPPIFYHPWQAESLQEFWGKRWHQLLRRTFLILGGYPCEWIGNKIGLGRVFLLFGTFLASGLFHELPCYLLRRSFDWRPPLFFLSQALLICLERAWQAMTGKKIRGWWGRLWVYFSLLILAQILVDSWHSRGLGGGIVIHPRLSPSRHLILPILNDTPKSYNDSTNA